jgi:hypothetical protein
MGFRRYDSVFPRGLTLSIIAMRCVPLSLKQGAAYEKAPPFQTDIIARAASHRIAARAEARSLPPGPEKEALLHRARRDEAAAHMSEWLRVPSFQSNK